MNFWNIRNCRKNPFTIICLRGGGCNVPWNLFLGVGNFGKLKNQIETQLIPLDFWFLEGRCDLCLDDHGSMSWPRSSPPKTARVAAPACIDSFFFRACISLNTSLSTSWTTCPNMGAYLCTTLCVWFNVEKGLFQQQCTELSLEVTTNDSKNSRSSLNLRGCESRKPFGSCIFNLSQWVWQSVCQGMAVKNISSE